MGRKKHYDNRIGGGGRGGGRAGRGGGRGGSLSQQFDRRNDETFGGGMESDLGAFGAGEALTRAHAAVQNTSGPAGRRRAWRSRVGGRRRRRAA